MQEKANTISYDEIERLRALDMPQQYIIPQKGGQEKALSSSADITIYGGKRGGGKTFCMLYEAIKDIYNPNFNAYIFRKKKDDFQTIIDTSTFLYSTFGTYNRAPNDMLWKLNSGGNIFFRYYQDSSYEEFKDRFQGREMPYIGIDEITQMGYQYFKYLLTCNRNSKNIRNRIFATCNPDPYSWVVDFIDWWIGEDGLAIPERSGVYRYCFMEGDSVADIIWGDTREEAYLKAKHLIDKYWDNSFYDFTTPEDMFIKKVTFIIGELSENKILLKSDPSYMSSLAQQDDEQRIRDLDGNWKFKEVGTDLISVSQMETLFENQRVNSTGVRYLTCDPALEGGDNAVFWIWEGNHILDIEVFSIINSEKLIKQTKSILERWLIDESNFIYDNNGLGQIFGGFFPKAIKFNNNGVPSNGNREVFADLKSECAYKMVQKVKNLEISIDPTLLNRRFDVKKHRGVPLSEILIKEKKAIRREDTVSDRAWKLISKAQMKKLVGWSPDFWESLITKIGLDIVKKTAEKPKGLWKL